MLMIGAIALLVVGLGVLCTLLYACAVYALPVAIGLWAGYRAMHTGAGVGTILIGLAAGGISFGITQAMLATRRPLLVWITLLAFTVPAVVAGYSLVLQFSELGIPSPIWRHVFAVLGATAVGCTVVARLTNTRVGNHERHREAAAS